MEPQDFYIENPLPKEFKAIHGEEATRELEQANKTIEAIEKALAYGWSDEQKIGEISSRVHKHKQPLTPTDTPTTEE